MLSVGLGRGFNIVNPHGGTLSHWTADMRGYLESSRNALREKIFRLSRVVFLTLNTINEAWNTVLKVAATVGLDRITHKNRERNRGPLAFGIGDRSDLGRSKDPAVE